MQTNTSGEGRLHTVRSPRRGSSVEQSDHYGQSPDCHPMISYWKCPRGPWRNSREYRGIGLPNLALVDQQFHLSQQRSAREKEAQERGAQERGV